MAKTNKHFHSNFFYIHGEIRRVEEQDNSFTSKDGKVIESKSILLKIDDDEEERIELVDKNSDNLTQYKKGDTGVFQLRVDLEEEFGVGNYKAKILIIGFEPDKSSK